MITLDPNIAYGGTFGIGFCSMRQTRVADGFTKSRSNVRRISVRGKAWRGAMFLSHTSKLTSCCIISLFIGESILAALGSSFVFTQNFWSSQVSTRLR
jgi:hypothetical protein